MSLLHHLNLTQMINMHSTIPNRNKKKYYKCTMQNFTKTLKGNDNEIGELYFDVYSKQYLEIANNFSQCVEDIYSIKYIQIGFFPN